MTVGFYSPLPPARTGVADYSAALLTALRARWNVRVNRDGDINLYHLGNNQLHAPIYRRALARPGVVVLHDAVLHHFMLGSLPREQYLDEFVYNYGEWSRGLAESLWRDRARSAGDSRFFQYPMLRRIAERLRRGGGPQSRRGSHGAEHCPGARVFEIPHLYVPVELPHTADAERLRADLGGGPLFGVFGHLRESKRVMSILRVFRRLPNSPCCWQGRWRRPICGAPCPSTSRGSTSGASATCRSTPTGRRRWRLTGASTFVIPRQEKRPEYRSGLWEPAKPVFMTDSLENSRYPDGTCHSDQRGPQ